MGLDESDHNGMTTMVWLKGMGLIIMVGMSLAIKVIMTWMMLTTLYDQMCSVTNRTRLTHIG